MKSVVYSRWDGTQQAFCLDARRALDALSDLMLEGLSVSEALEWMRRQGFELAGLDMRVMGLDELIEELRDEIRELEQRYRLDRGRTRSGAASRTSCAASRTRCASDTASSRRA